MTHKRMHFVELRLTVINEKWNTFTQTLFSYLETISTTNSRYSRLEPEFRFVLFLFKYFFRGHRYTFFTHHTYRFVYSLLFAIQWALMRWKWPTKKICLCVKTNISVFGLFDILILLKASIEPFSWIWKFISPISIQLETPLHTIHPSFFMCGCEWKVRSPSEALLSMLSYEWWSYLEKFSTFFGQLLCIINGIFRIIK